MVAAFETREWRHLPNPFFWSRFSSTSTGEQRGEEGIEKKGGRGIKIDRGNPLFRAPLFSGARDRATMDYEIYGTGEIKG